MTIKQITNHQIPQNLRRPILTDTQGLPRYWSTIWGTLITHDLEPSTEIKKLRYIDAFYTYCDETFYNGYLDNVLGAIDIPKIGNALEAYFIYLRNRSDLTQSTEVHWQTCIAFVKLILMHLGKSNPNTVSIAAIESKLHHLDMLYGQLRITRSRKPDILRSLPADVVAGLYDVLGPDSESCPFHRERTRWNAFLAFIFMLHLGLRRGEVLLLTADSLKSAYDVKAVKNRHWLDVKKNSDADLSDSRHNRPGIKTSNSIRQIPVSNQTAGLIQTYVDNYRGKPNHPFLFNSQWNRPLSHESLTDYFVKASAALPDSIKKSLIFRRSKNTISPHDLRHTCAVVLLNKLLGDGDSMEEALQKMRVFFGWSRNSDMPQKYARAVFEDRVSTVWANILNDRVAILRNIPAGV